jgi:outer membrane protein
MKKTLIQYSMVGLFGLLLNTPAHALDLWQTYEMALQNDATYQAASAQKIATDEQKKQARAVLFPTIVAGASWKQMREEFDATGRVVNTHPASASLSLKQPILQFDSFTAIKQVNNNVSIGALTFEAARQDLISRVVQTYFNALLTQKTAQVATAKEATAQQQVKLAQRNFDVGNTTVIDTQEANAAYHRAQAESIVAQSNAGNAWANLEDMVGAPITEPLASLNAPLKLKMPTPDTQDKWVKRAIEENYNVQIARLALKTASLEVTKRAQTRLPTLNLLASQTWKSTQYNHSNDVKSSVSSIGLEVSMPIFDGGLISAQVREAEALKTKSMQTVRSTQTQVAQATRSAFGQAVSGLRSIEALEEARKASSAAVRSNKIGYDLGMRINIDVLNAQQTDAQTQIDLAQAQYNTVIGNINLKAAIGQLQDDDVRYINQLLKVSPATKNDTSNPDRTQAAQSEPKSTDSTVFAQ